MIVVGAGAAGCLYAARLARAGKRVAVVESGPAWQVRDLYSSQIWARRLKWRGPLMHQPPGPPVFSQTHATGSGFGGAALHHFGTWLRLRQPDFKLLSMYGRGLDWPIDYDDLRSHYDSIQLEMGIAGDAAAESTRPPGAPYPMPPHRLFKQARMLERGFVAQGLSTAPLPLAINSATYRGSPACLYDGWCEAGCPIGALANPLVTHFAMAQRDGATFHAETTVTRVLADASGRATGIECLYGTARRIVRAKVVILATSVIENPRLLLNSGTEKSPGGLANSSGLVGAYFNMDAVAIAYGMFAEETENHLGVNAGQTDIAEGA